MKKILIIIFVLSATLFSNAQQTWTLQQCIDTALANNRNVKQKELNRQNSEIAFQQSKNNLLPDLGASADQRFNFGRSTGNDNITKSANSTQTSFSVSSSVTLFDGLKMKYNIDARKADLNASEADLHKIQSDLVLSVSSAFLQVLLNKELLQIAHDQLNVTHLKIEQQRELVVAGKIAEGEMYELIAQESKEDMNRIKAEQTLKYSLLDLAQIIEIEDFENMDVIVPNDMLNTELQLLDPNSVYESALNHRPEIRGAEFRLERSQKDVSIAKSNYYPSLNFGARVGTGYSNLSGITNDPFNKQITDNLGSSLGLSLSIPLFQKFQIQNQVKTSKLNVESTKLELENTKIELRKTIQQAYQNAISAKARWEAAIKSEIANREAYRFANQKYENGRATSYELFQAKSNHSQALSEITQAKYEYVFRIKILEWLR